MILTCESKPRQHDFFDHGRAIFNRMFGCFCCGELCIMQYESLGIKFLLVVVCFEKYGLISVGEN